MKDQINYTNEAERMTFTAFLNCYVRDVHNGGKYYFHVPQHDPVIADYIQKRHVDKWLKLELNQSEKDVFCPLNYHSLTGRHQFNFPVVIRNRKTDELIEPDLLEFASIVIDDYVKSNPEQTFDSKDLLWSLENSKGNTAVFLAYRNETLNDLDEIYDFNRIFIDAERSLLTGHAMHPVPKNRSRINKEDLMKYSPETKSEFQVVYYLAHPSVVKEKSSLGNLPTTILKDELLEKKLISDPIQKIIEEHKDWKLIPVHPWESTYLRENDTAVQELIKENLLIELGAMGPVYTPTSSVRTIYSENSDLMLKLSIHMKITNSERCNLFHELVRGHEMSELMRSEWGRKFKEANPDFIILEDPGYIAIEYKGEKIKGFNTTIRENPFNKELKGKNISMLGELCQDGLLGHTNRLKKLVQRIADKEGISVTKASKKWFEKYLDIYLDSIISIYIDFGWAFEAHRQNILLELDEPGYPHKIYFRDNQGLFFREGKHKEALKYVPGIAVESESFIVEKELAPLYVNYIMASNLMGMVFTFGIQQLIEEKELLQLIRLRLEKWKPIDNTGLVDYILNSRDWLIKSNLLTRLRGKDEASNPIENIVQVPYSNPLMYHYFDEELMRPKHSNIVYSQYFEKEDITIDIRPVDLRKDLKMLHHWFNLDYAKTFWKMDGPIRDLEAFYISLIDMEYSHAYIGLVNGEPRFTFEPYWPMKDIVGACYDALPDDYGMHLLVAPAERNVRYTEQSTEALMHFLFQHNKLGRCIGEADVKADATHKVITRVGFTLQKIIQQPHKLSKLTTCYREDFYRLFPKREQILEEA